MTRPDPPALLVINAGSSSLKFALYGLNEGALSQALIEGEIEGLPARPRLHLRQGDNRFGPRDLGGPMRHAAAIDQVLTELHTRAAEYAICAVGHRVVHGGTRFAEPVVITPAVLDVLDQLVSLAPLHQPHNLAAIRASQQALPGALQVACFDTAFHQTCPAVAQRFALPRTLEEAGIRRYGFHGLSYEYIARALPKLSGELPPRVLIAHLGAGSSLCALKNGKSHATTMGFTALDGLMMGTRCGNLDPGVVLHLLGSEGMTLANVTHLLYHQSGLLGVSGVSADMRTLLESPDPKAAEAIELYCYRVVREIGSLAAAIGGLDALVFTAGIGQHAAPIRTAICSALGWMGVALDEAANRQHRSSISTASSDIAVWVIPTDEQGMIATHTHRLLAATHQAPPHH